MEFYSKDLKKDDEDTSERKFESCRGYFFIFKNKNIIGDKMAHSTERILGMAEGQVRYAWPDGRLGAEGTGARILPVYAMSADETGH